MKNIYVRHVKRLFDTLLSIQAGVLLFPLMLFIALIVRINMGSPILFKQNRPGFLGRPFKLYKFRTMTYGHDENGNLLSDMNRLTRLGRILRATSLDELPEIWNVFIGDMSIVGPRPLLTRYLDRYTYEQARRHNVKPGITGWAQINGRNSISWDQKFKNDVWYVDNQSFWLDVKIIFLTVIAIFKRDGVNESECSTMTEFFRTEN